MSLRENVIINATFFLCCCFAGFGNETCNTSSAIGLRSVNEIRILYCYYCFPGTREKVAGTKRKARGGGAFPYKSDGGTRRIFLK